MTKATKEEKYQPQKSLEGILETLHRVDIAKNQQREWNENRLKEGYNPSGILKKMGELTTGHPDYFFAVGDQKGQVIPAPNDNQINLMMSDYREQGLDGNRDDILHYRPEIISRYAGELDLSLAQIASAKREEIKKSEKSVEEKIKKELKGQKIEGENLEEQIEEIVRLRLYDEVGSLIRKVDPSDEYLKNNPDVKNALDKLKEIDEAVKTKDYRSLVPSALEQRELPESFGYAGGSTLLAKDYIRTNGYQRIIGKKFIKYADGKYTLDREALQSYAGENLEAYATITTQLRNLEVFRKLAQAQKEAEKKK